MAQMPIHLLPGRADAYFAAHNAQPVVKGAASPFAGYPVDPGGIAGDLLRPGAIDQDKFKTYLANAQKQSATAPPAAHLSSPPPVIPTLSPAQFAALGAVPEAVAGGAAPGATPADAAPIAGDPWPFLHHRAQAPSADLNSGLNPGPAAATPAAPQIEPAAAPGPQEPGASPASPAAPPASPAAPSASPAAPSASPAAPVPSAQASAERGPVPGSHRGADGVWELPRLPDKDERDLLRGQKWRVVESAEARTLFFGPDGKFGWDDFADLINPLQHIPFVNMAYRAITGDRIYGAARMVDLALGPLAGASTAVDLAFQSTTGQGLADNAVAALFGSGHGDGTAIASVSTASDGGAQLADARTIRRGSHQ